jgi:hypothetical protein
VTPSSTRHAAEVAVSAVPWWHRALLVVGAVLMLVGAIDPLEGSLVILPGIALAALEAFLGRSRYARLLAGGSALVGLGVVALMLLSARGGIGRPNGLPWWTVVFLLPYPAGWVMGVVGVIRRFGELRKV